MSDTHNDTQSSVAMPSVRRTVTTLRQISELAQEERELLLIERPEIPEALLDFREVMAALRIGRTRYQDLVGSGELGSVKAGRVRLVPASELRRWIAANVNARR